MVFTNANPFAGFDLAEHLRDCITPYLEGTTSGLPARVCVTSGEIAWDDCECGQLAVSLTNQYETASFPTPWSGEQNQGVGKCGPPLFVFEYTISMTRCSPIGDNGNPPTCAQLGAAARVTVEDAWAVRAGLMCCMCAGVRRDPVTGVKLFERYWLGQQIEVGPGGMCQGSEIMLSIGVLNEGYPCGIS
jgi:hypothetical protein